jgi:hypothetical protein
VWVLFSTFRRELLELRQEIFELRSMGGNVGRSGRVMHAKFEIPQLEHL